MKKTKIIATVGPSTWTEARLIQMYNEGVNVLRFNFSHADYENCERMFKIVKKLNKQEKTNLSVLMDTKGPEIRTGDLKEKLSFVKNEQFKIVVEKNKAINEKILFCDYKYLIQDMNIGDIIRIDSGLFDVKVIKKAKDYLLVEGLNDAIIGSRRHINLPGIKLKLPGISEQDKKDIDFCLKYGIDFIAMSFVRNKENIAELRDFLKKRGAETVKIISKIENQEAIENMEEIIENSDGVMVARGDLGIEVPIEHLPIHQKLIVKSCKEKGKIVIVATHLLESMINEPFPTRAEVSDVFNSVLQKVDSLMLSGETAVGKYPIKSIRIMVNVIKEAELNIEYKHPNFITQGLSGSNVQKKMLIRHAIEMSEEIGVKAMLIFSITGRLGGFAAAFRPNCPIFAFTPLISSKAYMNLLFGIEPHLQKFYSSRTKTLEEAIKHLLKEKVLNIKDKVVAVLDVLKNGKEMPIVQIINIKDFMSL